MSKKKDQNLDKLINFVEEFAWLLSNYKGLQMENALIQMKDIIETNNNLTIYSQLEENGGKRIRSLVGIFPELFQNRKLFPTNQSIIEFANEVLQMNINPSKNRSKTEIIGEIVCATYSLTSEDIKKVVSALNKMVDSDIVVESVKEMKRNNTFSWNEIIQKLAE